MAVVRRPAVPTIVVRQQSKQWVIRLDGLVTLVGSKSGNDVRIPSGDVSGVHVAFVSLDNAVRVRDLMSRTGVRVNDVPVAGDHELANGDTVRVSAVRFRFNDPGVGASAETDHGDRPAVRMRVQGWAEPVRLDGPLFVVGRRRGADLVLDDPTVSAAHALLIGTGGRWFVRDLCSRTGTWVDGQRVTLAEVRPGDTVTVGATRFRLEAGDAGDAAGLAAGRLLGDAPAKAEAATRGADAEPEVIGSADAGVAGDGGSAAGEGMGAEPGCSSPPAEPAAAPGRAGRRRLLPFVAGVADLRRAAALEEAANDLLAGVATKPTAAQPGDAVPAVADLGPGRTSLTVASPVGEQPVSAPATDVSVGVVAARLLADDGAVDGAREPAGLVVRRSADETAAPIATSSPQPVVPLGRSAARPAKVAAEISPGGRAAAERQSPEPAASVSAVPPPDVGASDVRGLGSPPTAARPAHPPPPVPPVRPFGIPFEAISWTSLEYGFDVSSFFNGPGGVFGGTLLSSGQRVQPIVVPRPTSTGSSGVPPIVAVSGRLASAPDRSATHGGGQPKTKSGKRRKEKSTDRRTPNRPRPAGDRPSNRAKGSGEPSRPARPAPDQGEPPGPLAAASLQRWGPLAAAAANQHVLEHLVPASRRRPPRGPAPAEGAPTADGAPPADTADPAPMSRPRRPYVRRLAALAALIALAVAAAWYFGLV